MKMRAKTKRLEDRRALTSRKPPLRNSDGKTAAIKGRFPPGIAQPALRALVKAGLTDLHELAKVTEDELAGMHGMGPKAIKALRAGLVAQGLDLKKPEAGKVEVKKSVPAGSIDDYIRQCPDNVQAILERVRATIRKAAPEAQEVISYQMPAFKLHGILVYFAAWKQHIGLYPPISGNEALKKAVAKYAGPKGNLQFPLDKPIPYQLIERIVKLRVKQNKERLASKKAKKR